MANKLALGLVIGGAVSSTVGTAFKDVQGRIKQLEAQGTKARVLQRTIGDTIRLREEWKKANDSGAAGASTLLRKLESNLSTLKKQGVEVRNLAKAYQSMEQVARKADLKATGYSQVKDGKEGLTGTLGKAAAATALIAIPPRYRPTTRRKFGRWRCGHTLPAQTPNRKWPTRSVRWPRRRGWGSRLSLGRSVA